MKTIELPSTPALPKLYASALGAAARQRLGRKPAQQNLPAVRHRVGGVRVDAERLMAFAHLLKSPVRDVLPSGFVHVLAFPVAMSVMAREDFPLPLLGMVHLRNAVEHYAAINVEQELDITAWAENLRGHRSGTLVDLVAVVESDGTSVWRGTSTYLAKGVFLAGKDGTPSAPREDYIPPRRTARWELGANAGRAYAQVSGDFNPIHLSALSARALGMKRQIAHGMYCASRVIEDAVGAYRGGFTWEIEFEAPVFLPAPVDLSLQEEHVGGSWTGTDFSAWNPRSKRRHFHGTLRPLTVS